MSIRSWPNTAAREYVEIPTRFDWPSVATPYDPFICSTDGGEHWVASFALGLSSGWKRPAETEVRALFAGRMMFDLDLDEEAADRLDRAIEAVHVSREAELQRRRASRGPERAEFTDFILAESDLFALRAWVAVPSIACIDCGRIERRPPNAFHRWPWESGSMLANQVGGGERCLACEYKALADGRITEP